MSTPTTFSNRLRPRALIAALAVLLAGGAAAISEEPASATAEALSTATDASASPPAPKYEKTPEFNQADVAWMLVSSAFVLLMTAPGLFLFYGGLVRKKNVLSVFMQCLFLCGMNSVLWVLIGYSLAFSDQGPTLITINDDKTGEETKVTLFGGLDKVFLNGVGPYVRDKHENTGTDEAPQWTPVKGEDGTVVQEIVYPGDDGAIPELLFMIFQMMFFIITPALICGAFAERMKFSAMVAFTALWGLLIYCPLAHWVWGPNPLFGGGSPLQSLDFAGGLVVHASSGISALVCAIFLGKRLGYGKEPIVPHNMTYAAVGAALLWFGWFGFNAGSELAADSRAVNAFVATHLCAASALLGWTIAEWLVIGKPTVLGASSGIVAGLVVITPASGFVTPQSAVLMGLIAGVVCFLACAKLKPMLGYDDSLDAFGVHGVGGMLGALLTGVFVSEAIVGPGGIPESCLRNQFISVGVTAAFSIVGSAVILSAIGATIGLRVQESDEIEGLDSTQHGESGYLFD